MAARLVVHGPHVVLMRLAAVGSKLTIEALADSVHISIGVKKLYMLIEMARQVRFSKTRDKKRLELSECSSH